MSFYLLESGIVIYKLYDSWYARRYDPSETIDSKWDVLLNNGSWGSAAMLCLDEGKFDTIEEIYNILGKQEHSIT